MIENITSHEMQYIISTIIHNYYCIQGLEIC